MDKPWEDIDYREVRDLYNKRVEAHRVLLERFNRQAITPYVELALGIEDPCGNYSAAEWSLGPKIRALSQDGQVFELAGKLLECKSAKEVVDTIYKGAKLPNLKISVGSEMAMMLRPDTFWVTNRRTMWAQLVLKYKGDTAQANYELSLYNLHDKEIDSEMDYKLWCSMHPDVGPSLVRLASLGTQVALARPVDPGDVTYLWADSIANSMYNKFT
jgi:hypothetical protein